MAIEGILSAATAGLRLQSSRAGAAAEAIANVNTPGYRRTEISGVTLAQGGVAAQARTGDEGVDLTRAFVDLIEAQIGYTAGAQVVRVGQDLSRTLIDIVA